MANIFQKLGSAFGQFGMDNRMPTDQFLNLAKGDRRKMQAQGLQKFGEVMNLIGARQSGNPQRVEQAQNTIRQRMLDEEDAKRKAEQQALFDYQYSLLNEEQKRIVDQKRAGIEIPTKDRKIIKGADGFNYYMDGTRVLPNVNQKPDPNIDKTKFENADKLRDEHQKLSGTFIDVRDAYGRILTSAEEQTAASDLSLIFNYMKMLDPGSVVREGEFANAQNSAGVPSRIRARYNNVVSGERLAEDTRADFINQAQGLYKTQLASQSDLDKNYQNLATSYGLDSNKVVIDFGSPIAKKEFKYNISVMTIEDLASLDESQFTEEQKKIIEEEMKKRLK